MDFVYHHTENGKYKSNSVLLSTILCDTDVILMAKKRGTVEKRYYEWDFHKRSLKKGETKQMG